MKNTVMRWILIFIGLFIIFTLTLCCSMNRLQGYQFREHTVSALLAYSPPPEIFTDNWADVDFSNPVQAFIDIGTGIAKEVEVAKTRAKMDSAMGMVDIPEIVRIEILERGSKYLHYRAIEDTDDSDYLFDIEMRHYGIDAESWTAGVYFKIDTRITLIDNMKGKEIWRGCFDEKYPASGEFFGFSGAAGNIITMVSLSRLTTEQIALGLKNLAIHTSDRIIHKLQRDFSKKNQ
ncbi:hypothetical protein JW835_01035 [bacterium]|nr:hypothetical protein [bacterium]